MAACVITTAKLKLRIAPVFFRRVIYCVPVPLFVTYAVQVKKGLLEIYDATTKTIKEALARTRQATPIRFLHVSIDCWRVGKSARDDKYIGKEKRSVKQERRSKIRERCCTPVPLFFRL